MLYTPETSRADYCVSSRKKKKMCTDFRRIGATNAMGINYQSGICHFFFSLRKSEKKLPWSAFFLPFFSQALRWFVKGRRDLFHLLFKSSNCEGKEVFHALKFGKNFEKHERFWVQIFFRIYLTFFFWVLTFQWINLLFDKQNLFVIFQLVPFTHLSNFGS